MNIRLQRLHLKNFKGIKEFILDINGKNANIFGGNGTGKTTLYDSFLWVLFDKDSNNRKDFSIKTYDSNNNVIHGLEHEVEAVLLFDGNEIKFRKMLTEKWTKKRGEAEKEFTGHETSYWVDDVPVKKNEYMSSINACINENLFKLLTNPLYFNQQLSWQDRRKILLEISGDVSDQEVIDSNTKLSKITEILNGKSIDDYKKILTERTRKLNDDIEKIPVRIDELFKSIPEIQEDYPVIETKLQLFKSQLVNIEKEITNSSESSNEYMKNQRELYKLKDELEKIKAEIKEQSNSGRKSLLHQKIEIASERMQIETKLMIAKDNAIRNDEELKRNSIEIEMLRNNWSNENSKTFVAPNEDKFVCPTCSQSLPNNQIEEKVAEMKLNFENNKKKVLEKINIEGKSLASRNKELQELISKLAHEILSNETRLAQVNYDLEEIEYKLNKPIQEPDYDEDVRYTDLLEKIQQLQTELNKPIEEVSQELLQKKYTVTQQIDSYNKIFNNKEITEKTNARIEELKQEERKLASQLNELDGHKYLLEQFIKAKVNMLEESINNKFKNVKFQLFDIQINGALNECCNTLVNGVPWTDVNHAGQVNAGIDIINTLTSHYKVNSPIFVDNREAINELIQTDSQVINLIVSRDKQLRVEV